ncbi:MAG TPA: sugar kinase [Streptosporangiaceae bacterium]
MSVILTFGETMAALRSEQPLRLGGSLRLSVAGAESNVAIGLARLGHPVRWAGRVGADELGALIVRTLRAEGVDTGAVRTDPERGTGLLIFEERVGTVVRVTYRRAGSAGGAMSAADVLPALRDDVAWVHATGITAALSAAGRDCVTEVLTRARAAGAGTSLDINYRSQLWDAGQARAALVPLARLADVVLGSADELALAVPAAVDGGPRGGPAGLAEIAGLLLAGGAREVVVKQGAGGAEVLTAAGRVHEPARPVPVVDVIGAGDAFTAGYLSARLDGADLAGRLRRGVTAGAFAVAQRGDWEGLPSRDELALLDGDQQEARR